MATPPSPDTADRGDLTRAHALCQIAECDPLLLAAGGIPHGAKGDRRGHEDQRQAEQQPAPPGHRAQTLAHQGGSRADDGPRAHYNAFPVAGATRTIARSPSLDSISQGPIDSTVYGVGVGARPRLRRGRGPMSGVAVEGEVRYVCARCGAQKPASGVRCPRAVSETTCRRVRGQRRGTRSRTPRRRGACSACTALHVGGRPRARRHRRRSVAVPRAAALCWSSLPRTERHSAVGKQPRQSVTGRTA